MPGPRGPGVRPTTDPEETVTPLPQVTTVVSARDEARRDDVLAVAVLLANFPNAVVHRRGAVGGAELADAGTAVVGIGRVSDPTRMNFDYHHYAADPATPPTSSLTLVLDRLDLLPTARLAYPWLDPMELLASKGPAAAAKWAGTTADVVKAVVANPFELLLLSLVGGAATVLPKTPVHALLLDLGRTVLDPLLRLSARLALLAAKAKVAEVETGDGAVLAVVDASFIDRADDPTLGLEVWVKANCPGAVATITQDDRGSGLALFRRNDSPRIDLSVLDGTVGTTFAHAGGFVAKLAAGVDPVVALKQAVKTPVPAPA